MITVRYHFLRPQLSCRSPDAVICTQSSWLYMEPTLPREWGDYFNRAAMPPVRVEGFNMSSVSQAS